MITSITLIIFFLVMSIKFLRRNLISRVVYKWAKKNKVALSAIEKSALESGDVGFEKYFFQNKFPKNGFSDLGKLTLTDEEACFIREVINPFCLRLNEWEIRRDNDLPADIWLAIKQNRLWGITLPKSHQGLGFSELAHAHIIARIASRSMVAAITVMVPNALGPAFFILNYGTEQQKSLLADLATGQQVGCFGLTSVTAGSDAGSITDTGVVVERTIGDKTVLGLALNWNKRYITLAPIATLLGLAVRVSDPNGLLPKGQKLGITLVLVPTDLPGVAIGDRHNPMGIGLQNGPTNGVNVFIPLDSVIGGVGQIGHGWDMMMAALAGGRGLSLPGLSTALAQRVLSMSTTYAVLRRQFGQCIGDLQGILSALTPMIGFTFMIKATQIQLAESITCDETSAIQSAMAKYHLTEMARQIIQLGMDIQAGRAVQLGPNNTIAELYAVLPILTTVEGANILTRHLIIFGQALLRCHPHLIEETKSFELPASQEAFQRFDQAFFAHVTTSIGMALKVIFKRVHKRKAFWKIKSDSKFEKHFIKELSDMRNKFLLIIDITLLVYGKKLKNTEKITVLLGDALSFLYLSLNSVRYYAGHRHINGLELVAKWSAVYGLNQVEIALNKVLQQCPSPLLSKVAQFWIRDNRFQHTADTYLSDTRMAENLQKNPDLLQFLTDDCVFDLKSGQACDKMRAWGKLHEQIKPLFKQLQLSDTFSSKIKTNNWQDMAEAMLQQENLPAEQHALIKSYASLSWETLQVDEFMTTGRQINE